MNDVIFAEKFGSQFLLNVTANQIGTCKNVEATIDMHSIESSQSNLKVEIKWPCSTCSKNGLFKTQFLDDSQGVSKIWRYFKKYPKLVKKIKNGLF